MKFLAILIVALVGSVSCQDFGKFSDRLIMPIGMGLGSAVDNLATDKLGQLAIHGACLGGQLGNKLAGGIGQTLGQCLGNNLGNILANQAGKKLGLGVILPTYGCILNGLTDAMRLDMDIIKSTSSNLSPESAAIVDSLLDEVEIMYDALVDLPNNPSGMSLVFSQASNITRIVIENDEQLTKESPKFKDFMSNTKNFLRTVGAKILADSLGYGGPVGSIPQGPMPPINLNAKSNSSGKITPVGLLNNGLNFLTGDSPMSVALRMGLSMTPVGPWVHALTTVNKNYKESGSLSGALVNAAGTALPGPPGSPSKTVGGALADGAAGALQSGMLRNLPFVG